MQLEKILSEIEPLNKNAVKDSREKWDKVAKPLCSLGDFEDIISKLSGIYGNKDFTIDKKALVIMCADNGVIKQKVARADVSVTAIMADNFTKKTTTVCSMANYLETDIIPIDIGIARKMDIEGLINKNIMLGTNDISKGPAMSREQAIKAIEYGIDIVKDLKEKDYKIIVTGEMGIGNTTTSAAIASILLNKSVEEVTGYGAGLSEEAYKTKVKIVQQSIDVNNPDKNDPIDIISKVGGLDIAGMVGLYIGASYYKIPILIDGVISGISALLATMLAKNTKDYMIATHLTKEPAGLAILNFLKLKPFIHAGMCLGEGTGAMMGLSLILVAVEVYNKSIKFEDINIEQYKHFK